MFHVECESHLSGGSNIQFCYCGYDLCNQISGAGGRVAMVSVAMISVAIISVDMISVTILMGLKGGWRCWLLWL